MQKYRLKLDLQYFAGEKTEKATPKKRQEARKKGQVAKSMELPSAFIFLFSFLFLYLFSSYFSERIKQFFIVPLTEFMQWETSIDNVMVMFGELVYSVLIFMLPLLILTMVLGFISNYVQIGFLFTPEPLKMKLSKLNPIEGAKKIFSLRAAVEFLKSILKVTIIGSVSFFILWNERMTIYSLSSNTLEYILSYTANLTVLLGILIGLILIVVAVIDYMYQKYDFEKQQRMSKQDIKDEYKKTEGDPLIKSKIKEKQRQMAMQRMMQEVPNADVVITNPTHYAVAIKYDVSTMQAPLVLAKGTDYVALKIKEVAKEHQITTMENKQLARALYQQVEIGDSIPNELFQAVAEVLAYVYKLKQKQ
ncbi:flagellar biosynthesis protein FlhB [Chengkuizengella axinellae]|uniref:Flagellar biosynthetic protein FlhB n=1 Tax=Chengkuizengella axinellae TaxID=3064388 RepID=A0ABT9IVS6_9BACL|nr:flagellar biosynthesis protein FlhB [Chengkuizengella sp. 2205SS18-9]MDP5273456.1 flagellar biosynthesis protein FlhB [Chengkuizengella sp. 2205SS18-9]